MILVNSVVVWQILAFLSIFSSEMSFGPQKKLRITEAILVSRSSDSNLRATFEHSSNSISFFSSLFFPASYFQLTILLYTGRTMTALRVGARAHYAGLTSHAAFCCRCSLVPGVELVPQPCSTCSCVCHMRPSASPLATDSNANPAPPKAKQTSIYSFFDDAAKHWRLTCALCILLRLWQLTQPELTFLLWLDTDISWMHFTFFPHKFPFHRLHLFAALYLFISLDIFT